MDDITEREKLLMNLLAQEKKSLDAFYSFTAELNKIYAVLSDKISLIAPIFNGLIYEMEEKDKEFFNENFIKISEEKESVDESS